MKSGGVSAAPWGKRLVQQVQGRQRTGGTHTGGTTGNRIAGNIVTLNNIY